MDNIGTHREKVRTFGRHLRAILNKDGVMVLKSHLQVSYSKGQDGKRWGSVAYTIRHIEEDANRVLTLITGDLGTPDRTGKWWVQAHECWVEVSGNTVTVVWDGEKGTHWI